MSPVSERAAKVRFRRALSLMAMTLVAPGTAQLTAGNRRVGIVAFRIYLGLLIGVALTLGTAAIHHKTAFWLATDPTMLLLLRLLLLVLAVGWAYLFIDAWRIGQPLSYGLTQRRMAVGVNGLLCFGVAGTLLFGAHLVAVQRDFIETVFGSGTVTGSHDGRFNVLLLGGDSGESRWGLRTDSMTVASIDATTGKTVLISLPRNMTNFPFAPGSVMAKQFPHGFNCDDCMLNGLTTWAEDHQALFGNDRNAGTDATIMGIEGITGLKINYWAMVNLEGFRDLVNAVGGITLNVRQPIPIGKEGDVTGYVKPGLRKLSGYDALWYARSRASSDDYSRMARQKCVMNAMLQQLSPTTVVENFESIEKATTGLISTDLPASELDHFIDLALKARGQKVSFVSLVPPLIETAHPDIAVIRRTIDTALNPPAPSSSSSSSSSTSKKKAHHHSADKDVMTEGSYGSLSKGYAANQSADLSRAC